MRRKSLLLISCILISLSVSACATVSRIIHYPVKGQVVDAQTGKPISGAALAIRWGTYKIAPPLASGYVKIKTLELITNEDGFFKIPKYPFGNYEMCIYKKGYVCWNNKKIFLKGNDPKHSEKLKSNFDLNNRMIIKLEPLTNEYSTLLHAGFVDNLVIPCGIRSSGLFMKEISSEIKRWTEHIKYKNKK